jgi:membrane protein DedA with SNARE-associated domain
MITNETLQDLLARYGASALFVLLMTGIVGLPVPDEALMATTGFLIQRGKLPTTPAVLAAFTGTICGITVSYTVGRVLGLRLLHRYGSWLHLTEKRLALFHRWYERFGRWFLLIGYFIPGVRHVTAIAAGALGLSWRGFAPFAYGGAMIWVATFLTSGYLLAGEWQRTSMISHRVVGSLMLAVILFLVLVALVRRRHRAEAAMKNNPDRMGAEARQMSQQ